MSVNTDGNSFQNAESYCQNEGNSLLVLLFRTKINRLLLQGILIGRDYPLGRAETACNRWIIWGSLHQW